MKVNDPFPAPPTTLPPTSRPSVRLSTAPGGPSRDGTPAAGATAAPAADVTISNRSRELHHALRAAAAAPDVREDVVADIQARLRAGTYRIDPERIARGMLDTSA
jgi:negative regulator of flagellin synthesis FlgM